MNKHLVSAAVSFTFANFAYQFFTREDYALAIDRSFFQVVILAWVAVLVWRSKRVAQ